MSTAPGPAPLKLTPEIKALVNNALARGHTISVAYVSPEGRPELSFRGSVQAYSDTQLAIWVRNPEGGIVKAVQTGHPHVSLLYGELGETKAFLTFRGRGHIETADAVRRKVYDSSHELERNLDKDRKGVPLIIDLDSAEGLVGGAWFKMQR